MTWNVLAALLIMIFVEFAIAMSLIMHTMSNYSDKHGVFALSNDTLDARAERHADWSQAISDAARTEEKHFLEPASCYAFAQEHDKKSRTSDAQNDLIDYGIAVTYKMQWGGPIIKRIEYILKTENISNNANAIEPSSVTIRSNVMSALDECAKNISESSNAFTHIQPIVNADAKFFSTIKAS